MYGKQEKIPTYDGQDVAEHVGLGDGPVNVRDDNLVRVMPQVDVTPEQRKKENVGTGGYF